MTELQDNMWMWINHDGDDLRGAAALGPVLERLASSFLPPPSTVEATGLRERAIDGWTDPALAEVLDREKESTSLAGDGLRVEILQGKSTTTLSILFRVPGPEGPSAEEIRSLFADLCVLLDATYGRCHLQNRGRELHDAHYAAHPRTFYASGVYWLNFFGPDELARQGGAALAENPHARATRVGHGLLLEVGNGPLDAATPEGERRLVEATAAMPPPAAADDDGTGGGQPTTVNGVRGFFDHGDNSFCVTKHLQPGSQLDRRTVERLAGLRGQGDPPIEQVHVLFSDREAALANKDALDAAGVSTWYVADDTGEPRRA